MSQRSGGSCTDIYSRPAFRPSHVILAIDVFELETPDTMERYAHAVLATLLDDGVFVGGTSSERGTYWNLDLMRRLCELDPTLLLVETVGCGRQGRQPVEGITRSEHHRGWCNEGSGRWLFFVLVRRASPTAEEQQLHDRLLAHARATVAGGVHRPPPVGPKPGSELSLYALMAKPELIQAVSRQPSARACPPEVLELERREHVATLGRARAMRADPAAQPGPATRQFASLMLDVLGPESEKQSAVAAVS